MQIDQTVFERPVQGVNLRLGSLVDQLDDQRPVLLVFLRHFG